MSRLVVKKKHGIFTYAIDDIVYMEKDLRKIRLHTRCEGCGCSKCCSECKNCDPVEFYGKFHDIIPLLDERFLCCHRSYVINMDAIVWMCDHEIFVVNNKSIHMGKDAYGRARKIFTEYLNKKYPEKTLKNPKFFL